MDGNKLKILHASHLSQKHALEDKILSEVDRPFPQEQEYADKSARLKALHILLNMGEKNNEILDTEPDEGGMEPQPRTPGRGR